MTASTFALAETAVNIILSASNSADNHTETDAKEADVDLLKAHQATGKMDDAAHARAFTTISMIESGQRRY